MVYRGHVKDGVVVFDGDFRLPEGTEVNVEPIASEARPTLSEQFADLIGAATDLPEDLAENHDHYVHGTPKK